MPVKRRLAKARRHLEDGDLDDLFYGPGTCLFNGSGYLGQYGDGRFADKTAEVKAAVLEEMQADWHRHEDAIMEAWADRTEHDRYIAAEFHGDPPAPWVAMQFGEPAHAD